MPVLPRLGDDLTGVYRDLIGSCPALRVRIVDAQVPGPGPAWIPMDQLTSSIEELLTFESGRIAATHGAAPPTHVTASRLLHHYLWSAALLISGPWYLERLVPELPASDVWIHPPSGNLALRPGRGTPGHEGALLEAVATHIEPVLAAFQPFTRRGPRALWGMAADDLISGIWHLGRVLGEEARAVEIAEAVLREADLRFPTTAGFRTLTDPSGHSHWTRTRRGCCLYYAIKPAEPCITCPRTPDSERIRRLAG